MLPPTQTLGVFGTTGKDTMPANHRQTRQPHVLSVGLAGSSSKCSADAHGNIKIARCSFHNRRHVQQPLNSKVQTPLDAWWYLPVVTDQQRAGAAQLQWDRCCPKSPCGKLEHPSLVLSSIHPGPGWGTFVVAVMASPFSRQRCRCTCKGRPENDSNIPSPIADHRT